jgi:hypothetical protein
MRPAWLGSAWMTTFADNSVPIVINFLSLVPIMLMVLGSAIAFVVQYAYSWR